MELITCSVALDEINAGFRALRMRQVA